MSIEAQISFHQVSHSDALESFIRQQFKKLNKVYDRITSCRVTVEGADGQSNHPRHYEVKIYVHIPKGELVASKVTQVSHDHDEIYQITREAFKVIRRQIRHHMQKIRNVPKHDNLNRRTY